MEKIKPIEILAVLAALAALAAILLVGRGLPPGVDRGLHTTVGAALAREALSLADKGGRITVITRDTAEFPQPALDVLLAGFQREIRRADGVLGDPLLIRTDPLRPVDVPPGDFFELLRRASPGQVVVSLLGPPVLTGEQRAQLGRIKPKVVAFCPGSLAEFLDLRQLFQSQLLHSAVVARRPGAAQPGQGAAAFPQLYQVVRASDLAALAPAPEAKP